jgi:hypothetical protein
VSLAFLCDPIKVCVMKNQVSWSYNLHRLCREERTLTHLWLVWNALQNFQLLERISQILRHQYQEKCQSHKEHTDTGVLLLMDHSQTHLEHKEQQSEDPGHMDISYIMQWWDKGHQFWLQNGNLSRGHTETDVWQ